LPVTIRHLEEFDDVGSFDCGDEPQKMSLDARTIRAAFKSRSTQE